jgi:hypothetical protein
MPVAKSVAVGDLVLDQKNYRTVRQDSEQHALHALVTIDPDYFWGIAASLLDNGYVATENILVIDAEKKGDPHIVKEGNRRVGALKMAHGLLKIDDLDVPESIETKLNALTPEWKQANAQIPCLVYGRAEAYEIARVVGLIHGARQLASRLPWNPVAKARQNRDELGAAEPTLDFLEAYLRDGKNLDSIEKEKWTGVYPITVLEEALGKIRERLGFTSIAQFAKTYPKIGKYRSGVERMVHDTGVGSLGFSEIRNKDFDFAAVRYGLPVPQPPASASTAATTSTTDGSSKQNASAGATSTQGKSNMSTGKGSKGPRAVGLEDKRSVQRVLRNFHPGGKHREKLVTLIEEARLLNLDQNKYAFCFILRSMFELSVKAYAKDHKSANIKLMDGSSERPLRKLLGDIANHMMQGNPEVQKAVKPAFVELSNSKSILSVDSLNQLVHHPNHSITTAELCVVFHRVFPLLQAMNP